MVRFFLYVLSGLLAGLLFDLFRTIRLQQRKNSRVVGAMDFLFGILCITLIGMFLYRVDRLMLSLFHFLGALGGLILYFLCLSGFFRRFFEMILKFFIKIFKIVLYPVLLLCKIGLKVYYFLKKMLLKCWKYVKRLYLFWHQHGALLMRKLKKD